MKIPKSGGIFQKILNISKKFLPFTQKWCKNNKRVVHSKNRSELKSMKKAEKVVGVLWGCRGGAKNEGGFFSENSVNFFKKSTSYWNLKKN